VVVVVVPVVVVVVPVVVVVVPVVVVVLLVVTQASGILSGVRSVAVANIEVRRASGEFVETATLLWLGISN
jgi:hypothetical protein